MTDLYTILGVKRTAARKDIHKAYRKKAKTAHPDSGGTVEAFNELVVAYSVLTDEKRRTRYDETGEIDPPRPDNFDGGAIEIIAEKLGLVIHAEHDLATMDVGALIEQAIREDITARKTSVSHQQRAGERLAKLRAQIKRKAEGDDNLVARVLDWHELAIQNRIKKHEDSIRFLERALEMLEDYSFADDMVAVPGDEVTGALNDILVALDELAAILNTSPARAEAMPQGAGPTAFG
ncbi:MAG TPA: DnaJ domain-containing protein [Methyloceanibacter sp.]|nr:DnaJ domain-containing protein [Methyloceanibacter sp.]